MSTPFVVAVPSKGRLQENAESFFARAGLTLSKAGGARDYRGTIAGVDNVERASSPATAPPEPEASPTLSTPPRGPR